MNINDDLNKSGLDSDVADGSEKFNTENHWNQTYIKNDIQKLGWFEEVSKPSLELLQKCNLRKESTILNVGVGATTFIDDLIDLGYKNIIANDISREAIQKLKDRLGEKQSKVKWIVDDITQPLKLNEIKKVDLWNDRAVLHFFTDKKDQDSYFNLLKRLVKYDGYVIIAVFNYNTAKKCSGLPVLQYDVALLQENLGEEFQEIESFNYDYKMPSGDKRDYIYTLFKRIEIKN